ncbi:uncharacterized protein LOC131329118 [Rhododendron vialii]|uniref:uncharacterized protein LOC131329118 n=1 Tax=Rhododendron vialii TaxID=182163 RepID=UPI00265EA606|nr:uncharacterized protein LOC131329118 [Rhododendron vialii]
MGNVISSFVSGLGTVINKLFGSPLDFLSGKSCSSICGSTWDFICYIENFCVAHLLKLAVVSVLLYFVLLFFYSLYKLGICQCVCQTLCKMAWASFATFFSIVEFGCTFLCYKLPKLKRRHRKHKRDIERFCTSSSDGEEEATKDRRFRDHKPGKSLSRHWRDYRREHLRRSLRARSHRVTVGIRRDGFCVNKRNGAKYGNQGKNVHDIRVTRTSKFAQKRGDNKGSSRRMGRKK